MRADTLGAAATSTARRTVERGCDHHFGSFGRHPWRARSPWAPCLAARSAGSARSRCTPDSLAGTRPTREPERSGGVQLGSVPTKHALFNHGADEQK